MCGRYASSRPPELIAEKFDVAEVKTESLKENFNVAPTTKVYAVLERSTDEDEVQRQLRALRWGLVPSWAKDVKIGNRMINARAESVAEKPAYRRALAKRRCLIPADGYYEWLAQAGRPKQPFFIRRRDGEQLAIAGLYELWRDKDAGDDAEWLWSCTIITTDANSATEHIHDRMPVVLSPKNWGPWLDPANSDTDRLAKLLVPAPAKDFEAFPVSTQVNNVRNNGPHLLDPIPADET